MAANDHRLDIYVDAVTYMALRARADDQDRNISQHVRHLIRSDLESALDEIKKSGSGQETVNEGEG